MHKKLVIDYVLKSVLLFTFSCTYFQKKEMDILPVNWSGKIITFVDLDPSYKNLENLNRKWSKIHRNRYIPYYKFLDKKFIILGKSDTFDDEFFVIEDEKNRKYKMKMDYDKSIGFQLPSYLLFQDMRTDAEKMIGKFIWLNDTDDYKSFYTFKNYKFSRFEKVKVLEVNLFQNSNSDHPIWFKVESMSGYEGYVRYNGIGINKKIGKKDHYYLYAPLPKSWGKKTTRKILDGNVEIGMSSQQVRIAIGNPDVLNVTSSRHGQSEQWIYQDKRGNRTYLQFEYGFLTYKIEK